MHITVGENFITTTKIRNNYFAIVGRAITIWEAIQKEAMDQSTKLIQKLKQRGLERQLLLSQSWKSDN